MAYVKLYVRVLRAKSSQWTSGVRCRIHHDPQTAAEPCAGDMKKAGNGALVFEKTTGQLEQVMPSIGQFNAPVLAPERQKIITHLKLTNLFRQGRLRKPSAPAATENPPCKAT
jgi:hypothetical protein